MLICNALNFISYIVKVTTSKKVLNVFSAFFVKNIFYGKL